MTRKMESVMDFIFFVFSQKQKIMTTINKPKTAKKQSKSRQLTVCMNEQIELCRREKRLGSACCYLRTRDNFIEFLATIGKTDIPMSKLTSEVLAGYQEWILGRGRSRNTLSFHMRNLRSVYHWALKDGRIPLYLQNVNPFEHVFTSTARTCKRAQKSEIMTMLNQLDIANSLKALGKLADRRSFEQMVKDVTFARDTFVFCFCACGLPFIDFIHLTRENIHDGMLSYERQKTGIHIEMEILPPMQRYIDHYATDSPYLFPILTTTNIEESYKQYQKAIRKYNHRLKLLSQMLPFDINLSTYVARHTWATTVYHNNMPESYIKERMGHTSLQTTRTYLKSFESSKIDAVNKRIIGAIIQ